MIFLLPYQQLILLIPVLLMSLTIHEFAHARTALAFGDPTAKNMGRVTLNPIYHLDPLGTLALLFVGFGWAKPVPVNPYNLHPPKWGDIAVSIAGPISNLLLAVVATIILRILFVSDALSTDIGKNLKMVLMMTIVINTLLCTFNLMPLYPLDGHHIARELLPGDKQAEFMQWQMKYGSIVLIGIILLPRLLNRTGTNLGTLGKFLSPIRTVLNFVLRLLESYVLT